MNNKNLGTKNLKMIIEVNNDMIISINLKYYNIINI